MSATSQAWVTARFGAPPTTILEARPAPTTSRGTAVLRVKATSVNPFAHSIRSGYVSFAKAPLVLGSEAAAVVEFGERFARGTRVMFYGGGTGFGVSRDGTYQELLEVPENLLMPLPESFSFEEGGAFPTNYVAAYGAVVVAGNVQPDEFVVVADATGGLGRAVVQVAKALGARPIAVVSTSEKARKAATDNPAAVIDLSIQSLTDGVAAATKGAGATLGIDPVGGTVLGNMVKSLSPKGRLVSVGFTGGMQATIDIMDLIIARPVVTGFAIQFLSDEQLSQAMSSLVAWANGGFLRPSIDSTFTFDRMEEAFGRLTSRRAMGSIVMTM
jgi:NADPH:quinone reductase